MSSPYDTNLAEIKRNILAQKTIYKFRIFMYSLNKDIRHRCFDICNQFLVNEYNNNTTITVTEKDRLTALLNHWQWTSFENTSTDWWTNLSFNHSHSISLMIIIHMWIDDIQTFDNETFETSTVGLR